MSMAVFTRPSVSSVRSLEIGINASRFRRGTNRVRLKGRDKARERYEALKELNPDLAARLEGLLPKAPDAWK
jgi:hypothetical protein